MTPVPKKRSGVGFPDFLNSYRDGESVKTEFLLLRTCIKWWKRKTPAPYSISRERGSENETLVTYTAGCMNDLKIQASCIAMLIDFAKGNIGRGIDSRIFPDMQVRNEGCLFYKEEA